MKFVSKSRHEIVNLVNRCHDSSTHVATLLPSDQPPERGGAYSCQEFVYHCQSRSEIYCSRHSFLSGNVAVAIIVSGSLL